ncbi:hypothetical protein ACC817_33545 [Rhizobium ruizarguesonis]
MRAVLYAAVAIFTLSSNCFAQEDCLPVLKSDIVDLSHETETSLVLLERRLQEDESQNKGGVVASYGAYKFNADQARQARSSLSTLLNIDYSQKEKTNVYISTFSDNEVTAYIACLRERSDPISHNFVGDILSRDAFFVSINWHPDYTPEGAEQTLVAKVTEGVILESGTMSYETKIKDKKSAFFTVKRDRFKGTQIAVSIDGKNELIDVPPKAKYRVIPSELEGPRRATNTRETTGDIGWDVCVTLPPDDVDQALVPNTFDFQFYRSQVGNVRLVTNNPRRETSRSACSHLGIIFNEVWSSYAIVDVAGKVQIFKRIDVTKEEAPRPGAAISFTQMPQ